MWLPVAGSHPRAMRPWVSRTEVTGWICLSFGHSCAVPQLHDGIAMGANELLAADVVLSGQKWRALNATSVTISMGTKAAAVTDHAAASLRNAKAQAHVN